MNSISQIKTVLKYNLVTIHATNINMFGVWNDWKFHVWLSKEKQDFSSVFS